MNKKNIYQKNNNDLLTKIDNKTINVLMVDDSEIIICLYSSILNKLGVNYSTVKSGKDGLECYINQHKENNSFNLILTDTNLYYMGEEEMILKIREYEFENNLDKSIIYGFNSKNSMLNNKKIDIFGFDGFIKKDLSYNYVSRVIKKYKKLKLCRTN
jgi:CheY-like chemotaxis protein